MLSDDVRHPALQEKLFECFESIEYKIEFQYEKLRFLEGDLRNKRIKKFRKEPGSYPNGELAVLR